MLRIQVEASKILRAGVEYKILRDDIAAVKDNTRYYDQLMNDANSGDYQADFSSEIRNYADLKYPELEERASLTADVLIDVQRKAKGLIARCADFGAVIRGEEPLDTAAYESTSAGKEDTLYFEDNYCDTDAAFAGPIQDLTRETADLCKEEMQEIEAIKEALAHVKKVKITETKQPIQDILTCAKKGKNVENLYLSLVEYGKGVDEINKYVQEQFSKYVSEEDLKKDDGENGGEGGERDDNGGENGGENGDNKGGDNGGNNGGGNNGGGDGGSSDGGDGGSSDGSSQGGGAGAGAGAPGAAQGQNGVIPPNLLDEIARQTGLPRDQIEQFLKSGKVPAGWSNQQLLQLLYLLGLNPSIDASLISQHNALNLGLLGGLYTKGSFIENQSMWTGVLYGNNSSIAQSGCGLIAVANAMHALGRDMEPKEMADLISTFEVRGATDCGPAGTSPTAILEYMTLNGYNAEVLQSNDPEAINRVAANNDTLIVTVNNNGQGHDSEALHTVNIEKITRDDGSVGYQAHNSGNSQVYSTAGEAVSSIGGLIQLLGLSRAS